jgi:hypothetical protein
MKSCSFKVIYFGSEDGDDLFLRKVAISPSYMALQPRRLALRSHRCDNLCCSIVPRIMIVQYNCYKVNTATFLQHKREGHRITCT